MFRDFDVVFYDRFYNWEVMAGSYLVKNTPYAIKFLEDFASYETTLPNSFHGTDNGALHPKDTSLTRCMYTIDLCRLAYNSSKNYDDVFTYEACLHSVFGTRTEFDRVKVLKKGTGWARDSWITNSMWNKEVGDFMLHCWKTNQLQRLPNQKLHPTAFQCNPIPQDFKSGRFPQSELSEFNVKTHKGFVSLAELNENVYKRFGYEVIEPTQPVPTLRMINEPTCETVFADWLKVSEEPQPDVPPKEIPSKLRDEFLLYNYSALASMYFNDKNGGEKPQNWDKISELIKYPKEKLVSYGIEGVSMYHAMKAHRLDGMSGFVVGSMRPWVEISALSHGASKVLTVEYNNLTIQEEFRDRMSSILPVDFVKQYEKYAGTFDFAASFSSIEHSGVGRYGDPIDPIGDLREVLKIKCMLKKGGLFFLGVPLGFDAVVYNAHRVYGPIRLAMMFYGFEWLDTFSGEKETSFDLNFAGLGELNFFQNTMVLRKL